MEDSTRSVEDLTVGGSTSSSTPSGTISPPTRPKKTRAPRGGRCTYCIARKLKCSRTIPCDRCVDKGQAASCTASPASTGEQTVLINELQTEVNSLRRQVARLSKKGPISIDLVDDPPEIHPVPSESVPEDGPVIGAYLDAVLGMPQSMSTLAIKDDLNPPPRHVPRPWKFRAGETIPPIDLVPRTRSTALVAASLNFLAFMHASVHAPSYQAAHDRWLASLRDGTHRTTPEFLALYFAIISTGLFFFKGQLGRELGFSDQEMKILPRLYFDASIECLYASSFMSVPVLESIQTVSVLLLVAYSNGASAHIEHLICSSMRSIQALGITLLPAEVPGTPSTGVIRRELGRRLWLMLRVFESHTYAGPASGLFLPYATTGPVAHIDDEDLVDDVVPVSRPFGTVTITSYLLLAGRRADIYHGLHKLLETATSFEAQFQGLQYYDSQLVSILNDFPSLRDYETPFPLDGSLSVNAPFDFATWSRFIWSLDTPGSRILLHRIFLTRMLRDPVGGDSHEVAYSRKVCLDSARQYLKQLKIPVPELYHRPWTVSVYAVVVAAVLAAEYKHPSTTIHEKQQLRQELREVIDHLPNPDERNALVVGGLLGVHKMVEQGDALLRKMMEEEVEKGRAAVLEPMLLDRPFELFEEVNWDSLIPPGLDGYPSAEWDSAIPLGSEWAWLDNF